MGKDEERVFNHSGGGGGNGSQGAHDPSAADAKGSDRVPIKVMERVCIGDIQGPAVRKQEKELCRRVAA